MEIKIPAYIRVGEIPKNGYSDIILDGDVVGMEPGVAVWNAIQTKDGSYYPVLPDNPNDKCIKDYFNMLYNDNRPIYLVTGDRTIDGADGTPCLTNVIILKNVEPFVNQLMKNITISNSDNIISNI